VQAREVDPTAEDPGREKPVKGTREAQTVPRGRIATHFSLAGAARAALLLAVAGIFCALLLTACSGSGGAGSSGAQGGSQYAGGGEAAGSAGSEGGAAAEDVEGAGSAAAEGTGASAAASAASDEGAPEAEFVEDDGRSSGGEVGDFDRRVVKSAELGIRVKDVRETSAEAQRLAARAGGSVLDSRIYDDGGGTRADLVLSVPSERFEGTLDELRNLGREVTVDAVSGEDVTEEFVDLESRERNLLAAEESLLRLYDRAESVEDTLDVGAELTEVRGQIEEVQGRMQYLEDRTAFSRISLHVEPTRPVAVAATRPAWDPSTAAGGAWAASLNVLQTIATAVISAVVFGWWLVPFLALGFVLWRRRRSRTASRPAPPAADTR
jgi:hypothetical protein